MNHVTGIREVQRLLEEVGKAPNKVMTKAVKTGAKIIQQDAKTNAPVDTGKLKRSIKMKAEKYKKGKKAYQIKFIGEDLAKISKNGKRSFYPVSQEYGWVDQYGKRHPGKRYLRNALESNRESVKEVITEIMAEEIRKIR